MTSHVGIDIGATHVRAVVGDESGRVRARERIETPRETDGQGVAAAVQRTIRAAVDAAGVSPESIAGAGVGTIGPLDEGGADVVDPANLPTVERLPVRDPVRDVVGGDVVVYNDATAGAIGERFFARDAPDDLVYLTFSTGIGAGVIADGRVLEGANGNAGEIGHVTLDPDADVRCGCGGVGHWEAFAGGSNLPRYADVLRRTSTVESDRRFETAAEIFDAAGTDPLADRVLERLEHWNAHGVATVVRAYDPALVVVGGSVALHNPEAIVDSVESKLPELLCSEPPEIRLTERGDEAVVDGALAASLRANAGSDAL